MAVNLRATATLNTKPYIAGIKSIKAATQSLNSTAIKGTKAVKDGVLAEAAARQASSKAVRANTQAVTTATAASSKAMRQAATNTEAYNRALGETQEHSRRIVDSYAQMTPAMARHNRAVMDLARANVALANQQAQGLEGPALQRYQTAVDNAARSVGRARAAIIADNEKVAASTKKAADAQVARNAATTRGIADARAYAGGLSGLSQEKLKLQAASERLGAAEARLASAMARSNGVITPAVSQARAGVISATAAYNALSEAQANVGKTGSQAASGLAAQRYLYHDVSRQMFGLGVGLAAIPVAAVAVGAVWENQFANVIRTSEPDLMHSEQRINALRTSLVGMAKNMPTSFGNLTEIATLGNQMGVSSNELEGFTRAVAMFSATSGIAVDTAATAFGRLRVLAREANFSYMDVADSILKVGVNSVATEEEIINVTTQISSVAAAAGFSTKEMIGLSGAMASVRIPPELSRSIITRTFGQIDKAVQKNGTELQTIARLSGRTVDEIRKQWGGEQSAAIFTDFLTGLRTAGSRARGELESIGITSVRDVPSLMRLANAKDSDGVAGGLLTQTINDANNAAGTVQEQYSIMAETVVGRLKILGNTILSFFNTLGSQSSGFVKNTIDGLTNLFKFLDKIVDNPFANWALGAMAAVSGIALATSALAKLAAGVKMFQHVSSVTGASGFFSAIGKSGKAGGAGDLAAMSPMLLGSASLLNNMKTGATAAGTAWKNLGTNIKSAASGGLAVAASKMGATATANAALNTSLAATAATAPKVTGILGNLVRFGLSPVGIGLGAIAAVGTIGYNEWAKGFYEATTTSEQFSKSLASIDMNNIYEIDRALASITVSGRDMGVGNFWTKSAKPFAEGLNQMAKDLKVFSEYQQLTSQVSQTQTIAQQQYGAALIAKQQGIDAEAMRAGMKVLDSSFKEMRAAGNESTVNDFWVQLSRQADNASDRVKLFNTALEEMPEEKTALTNQFALMGYSLDEGVKKFDTLYSGMRDMQSDFEGTSIIADVLGIDDEAAATFGKIMNDATAAFIDFNTALDAGTKIDDDGVFTGFSMEDFTASLEDNIATQEAWMNNMRSLVTKTAPDVIEAMGELGPAGQHLAQSLVDGLASADPAVREQAEKTLATFEAAVYRSKIDFGPHLAEYKNVVEKAAAALGTDAGTALNAELAASLEPEHWSALSSGINSVVEKHGVVAGERLNKVLFEQLNAGNISVSEFSELTDVFSSIGYSAATSLTQALNAGVDFSVIQGRMDRIQMPKLDASSFEISDSAKTTLESQFRSMFTAKGVQVPVGFSLDTTMGELRTALNSPNLLPDIEADVTLNTIMAEGQLNGFRSWALANGIDVEVAANPNLAYANVASFVAHADSETAYVMLDALTAPGEGKLWEFVTLTNGTEAVVKIDADTGQVAGKIYELDTSGSEPVWKEINADTDEAKAAIESINAAASADQTKNVNVTDNGTASAVQTRINGITGKTVYVDVVQRGSTTVQANGSMLQFYANGGVRENHVAQIAPAGTNRVWAEAETGGEAYIPLAQSKRMRSTAILENVAERFGYGLVRANNTAQYANGGEYHAQAMRRTRATVSGGAAFGGGLTASDKQFLSHVLRTVVVSADGQRITGLTNNINERNARFGR